ncbi:MAG: fumarylacetoacetate hydrolase family protein [Immundisolibacter sp.]
MSLDTETITELAARLLHAADERRAGAPLSETRPDLDEADAYAIQAALLERRGGVRVGYKLGFTSAAMREQMGVEHPNSGVLLADMRLDTPRLPAEALIQPRLEPEIAILLARDLHGATVTPEQVAAATAAVLPALEVVDSRYRDYRFKAVDNIADNSSAARYRTGAPRALSAVGDLRLVGVLLEIDGITVDQGLGAAALGSPLAAVAWLVRHLAARGEELKAGELVLTGGLTRAHALRPGQTAVAHFGGGLGALSLHHPAASI